jgi:hypothetical protein
MPAGSYSLLSFLNQVDEQQARKPPDTPSTPLAKNALIFGELGVSGALAVLMLLEKAFVNLYQNPQ